MATKSKSKESASEIVTIKPIRMGQFKVRAIGDSPLIIHAWAEKNKRMIREAQSGKKKVQAREARNPEREFAECLYWISGKPDDEHMDYQGVQDAIAAGARLGIRVVSFKKAGNASVYRAGMVQNQTALRCGYFVEADNPYTDLVEIHFQDLVMREDSVKIGKGTADLRYRPEFHEWYCDLTVTYNLDGIFNADSIINTLNMGGLCGVGEWRPERDGIFGRYHIEPIG